VSLSIRRLLAEVLGAYVLVLVGGFAILASARSGATTALIVIAFGFGLALLAGLYAFGEVSGGHFNPAVSLAMVVDGRMDPLTMVQYWIAQVAGAVLAGVTILAASNQEAVASTATVLGEGVEPWEGFLLEVIFTAIFVGVILKTTTSDQLSVTAFLGISLTLVAVHLALVPFTGASVNPARSLGSGVVGDVWTDQWIYWIAPLVGAGVGWALYKAITTPATDDR
jgi:aquaporin Z